MNLRNPRWALAAAAAITVGATGIAVASDGGDNRSSLEGIDLQERVTVTATVEPTQSAIDIVPAPLLRQDGVGDSIASFQTFDSVQTFDSAPSVDSPNSVSVPSPDTVSVPSPDSVSVASVPTPDSVSVASVPSPDSVSVDSF